MKQLVLSWIFKSMSDATATASAGNKIGIFKKEKLQLWAGNTRGLMAALNDYCHRVVWCFRLTTAIFLLKIHILLAVAALIDPAQLKNVLKFARSKSKIIVWCLCVFAPSKITCNSFFIQSHIYVWLDIWQF